MICDLICATCGIEREIVDGAESLELFDRAVPIASAEAIVAMKVLSASEQRPRDLGDLQAILRAQPDLDQALVLELLNRIAERGFARGQNLVDKWADLRARFGS